VNNEKDININGWDKAISDLWSSPLITFNWSTENAFFIQMKIVKILEDMEASLDYLFKPHKDTQLVILHNKVAVVFGEGYQSPRGFEGTPLHPIVTQNIGENPTRMGTESFNNQKAAFRQYVSEQDVACEILDHILSKIKSIQASLEVSYIIKHLADELITQNATRKTNKRVDENA
jgi:hypothetical protein